MEEELNKEASELIKAARIPPTTIPVKPLGNNSFTRVEKAASLLAKIHGALLLQCKSDHSGNQEEEDRSQFQVGPEDGPPTGLGLVPS